MNLPVAGLALLPLVLVAPQDPDSDALTLRFGWPHEGQVQVREASLKKGATAEIAYTLRWRPDESDESGESFGPQPSSASPVVRTIPDSSPKPVLLPPEKTPAEVALPVKLMDEGTIVIPDARIAFASATPSSVGEMKGVHASSSATSAGVSAPS